MLRRIRMFFMNEYDRKTMNILDSLAEGLRDMDPYIISTTFDNAVNNMSKHPKPKKRKKK